MIDTTRRGKRLAAWIAAFGCGLWLLAQAAPADAQASRTRPGGGSSSGSASGGGSSSGSSSGGSSASSGGGSSSGGSTSSGPVSVRRSRPSGGSGTGGSPTVIETDRRPPNRGHGHGGHHHGHFSGGWYGGFYGYPYWSPWGAWWLGWDYPYSYGYRYGYPHYPPYGGRVYSQGGPALGALDTDVWPARTQVWIDGQYVGFVDQFDGFPRFLWLEKGTYDVVFYFEGYKTLARQYTIHPGLVIDVEDRLEPGESIHPTALAPRETPRRDARVRAERERRAAADEPEWRRRVRDDRERRGRVEDLDEGREGDDGGRLYLGVSPADAAVYLDGEFLGTAGDLGRRGVPVEPGKHELSVVHPDFETRKIEFEVEAGGDVDLDVDLEEAA